MFYKFALKNARRSLRDYLIYFLTLAFGVCLFYLFNSLDSQTVMLDLSDTKRQSVQALVKSIGYISVFVAIVLGFLIVYANNFLIRRRKKELGLYLTLGMEKGQVSRLLMLETFFVGLFALIVGLTAGVFLSQGFSVLTAKLFEANMKAFVFVFSPEALKKALLFFGVIFLIVMLFNVVSVSRLKLIDLLTGGRKNEKLRLRNLWVAAVLFVVSIVCLGFAYQLIRENGFFGIDWKFQLSILLGCVGTVLFFFSLSGFLLRVTQSSKKIYYRGLNMFTLRQFNSKINTTFVSVSVICLMLLVTIGTLATGLSLSNYLSLTMKGHTPYDASFLQYSGEDRPADIASALKKEGIELSEYTSGTADIAYYASDVTIASLKLTDSELKQIGLSAEDLKENVVSLISESDYNRAAKLQGKPTVFLGADGFAAVNTLDILDSPLNSFLARGGTLTSNGKTFKPAVAHTLRVGLVTNASSSFSGAFVLPDDVLKSCPIMYRVLNVKFKSETDGAKLKSELARVYGYASETSDADKPERPYDSYTTRQELLDQKASSSTVISYLALYIGLVFLIAGAAILAIQQLSESADNAERYGLLRKLGANERMVNRALFTQIGLYFLLPLSLAIVHSAVGISVVNKIIRQVGGVDIHSGTVWAVLIFVVIYGTYFLATYFGSRNMLRRKSGE